MRILKPLILMLKIGRYVLNYLKISFKIKQKRALSIYLFQLKNAIVWENRSTTSKLIRRLLLVTSYICFFQEVLQLSLIFPAFANYEYSPVNRKDPSNQNISQKELEHAYHKQSFTPFLAKSTYDHCSQT